MPGRRHGLARPLVFSVSLVVLAGTATFDADPPSRRLGLAVDAADATPVARSGGPLVSEIVTGADSASDEFVEIYNPGDVPLDLAGSELVYITASGATTTRKAAWTTATELGPRRHLLVANSLGRYAALADVVYSGGLSATGGTIALRSVDGVVALDAVGWGDASNAWVERRPAPAPPPGTSVERLPGGDAGNWIDTGDNLLGTHHEPMPIPQGRAAPAVPSETPDTPEPPGPPMPSATAHPMSPFPPTSPVPVIPAPPDVCPELYELTDTIEANNKIDTI